MKRTPDFSNVVKALHRERPDRPTPFELILGDHVFEYLLGEKSPGWTSGEVYERYKIRGFMAAGYDYATVYASDFHFHQREQEKDTISLNHGCMITDEASYSAFHWNDPESYSTARFKTFEQLLPEGAKLAVMSPGGVLENVMALVGYDNMCYMLYDDPELLQQIFNSVGSRLLRYYELAVEETSVGMLIANDDWGFNTQTFMKKADMERYVFPWHKLIVETAHRNGKPIMLHSCGYFGDMIDPVSGELGYDGKHSYEDKIMPVEDAYEAWHDKIAIVGGIDMNFLVLRTPDEIYARSKAMLERTAERGGYMLGAGNSVPDYVSVENYLAMMRALDQTL